MNFTSEHQWDIERGCVQFVGYDGDRRVVNRISEEALEDYFGHNRPAHLSVEAYRHNRDEIHRLAELAITEGQVGNDGGASISSTWLQAKNYGRKS